MSQPLLLCGHFGIWMCNECGKCDGCCECEGCPELIASASKRAVNIMRELRHRKERRLAGLPEL